MRYDSDYDNRFDRFDRFDGDDRDDSAAVIFNDRLRPQKSPYEDIPEEAKALLGDRPENDWRPRTPRGMSRTEVADTEEDNQRISVSDMSEAEIWDYFAEQAKVCTVNQFRQLLEAAYTELLDGANMLLMGAKAVKYIERNLPRTSASLGDYFNLYRFAHKEANELERMGWPNYRKARH